MRSAGDDGAPQLEVVTTLLPDEPAVTPLPALRTAKEQAALAEAAAAAEAIANEKASTRIMAVEHAEILQAHATLLSSEKYYTSRQVTVTAVERQKARARAEAAVTALAEAQSMRTPLVRRWKKKATVLKAKEEVERYLLPVPSCLTCI